MAGYSLYISDIPDIQSGHLCYRHSGNELPPSDIQQKCNLIGQYLTIYNMRNGTQPSTYSNDSLLILCEVQANECSAGFYGNTCNKTCGNCVNEATCNHVSGNCPGVIPRCRNGWKGEQCQTECEQNEFGADCSGRCGQCLNVTTCNPINGSCQYGCQDGWIGQNCEMNTAALGGQEVPVLQNAGIIFGASAGGLVLITSIVVAAVLRSCCIAIA
ncbi:hypothetical protein KUTeg_016099 [Tegillarca granosa]|uniref:Uncharacterized protein n=1 Tax=Tegillarca granosa TaxID=220873 RepID=A0ABQ9EJV2_TEGGR|nr:hypothetical protein KUTeg_016099 [Tegillarca granosa]